MTITAPAGRVWRKLGAVADDARTHDWVASHAALPVVEVEGAATIRVYFSTRDAAGRSHIAAGVLDLSSSNLRLEVEPRPLLAPGPLGAFDDSGVTSSCVVRDGGRRIQYYTGWTRGATVPFYFNVGAAVSDDGGAYRKVSVGPVLDRNDIDPYLTASPWVLVDGGTWRMWYVSGVRWTIESGAPKHYYHVRYAESPDGLHWRREGRVCIDFASASEYAIGRPCVIKDADGCYRMWYSYRGAAYRIGYAESADGIAWVRRDEDAGIEPSVDGWDSEMIEYPAVFDAGGHRYMLYNGNGYGKTGLGLAVLDA